MKTFLIIPLLFLLGSIGTLWSGLSFLRWSDSRTYPSTLGWVRYETTTPHLSSFAALSYIYEVDGVEYSSRNIAIGGYPWSGYIPNKNVPVPVYYNPQKPSLAYLITSPNFSVWLSSLVSPILIFISILLTRRVKLGAESMGSGR